MSLEAPGKEAFTINKSSRTKGRRLNREIASEGLQAGHGW
jgi:hypothetical protein